MVQYSITQGRITVSRPRFGEDPIERTTLERTERTVNQKTARALGVAVPQSVLMRADKVIE